MPAAGWPTPRLGRHIAAMIVDMRIYTTRPGKLAAFVMLYKDHAWVLAAEVSWPLPWLVYDR